MTECAHPLAEVRYRVTSLNDADWLNPEIPNRDCYETWTCDRVECIIRTVMWTTPKSGMIAYMYTTDNRPVEVLETLRGNR